MESKLNKKKIIIVSHGLRLGGVERSLLGLLGALSTEKVEVFLFLHNHDGELFSDIPPNVKVLPESKRYAALDKPIRSIMVRGGFHIAMARLTAKFVTSFRKTFFGKKGFLLLRSVRYSLPFLPSINGTYDLAISFLTPHDVVIKKVNAKKKIGFIHTDYSSMDCGVDKKFELPMWLGMDSIAGVSKDVNSVFAEVFPDTCNRLMVVENILSEELIRRDANASDVSHEISKEINQWTICSIGRFCYQKNFESIPEIVDRLNQQGIHVKWYLIGYGPDESLIREKVEEFGVPNQVVILGKQTNPYPYIKACDIYAQPSRFEGKAVAVREAQILGKPVLITDFPTSKSQLEDGIDGAICPLSVDGVVDGIKQLIDDSVTRNRLAVTASSRDYSNRREVDKLLRLL